MLPGGLLYFLRDQCDTTFFEQGKYSHEQNNTEHNDWLERSGVAIPGERLTLNSDLSKRLISFEKLDYSSATEADSSKKN